VLHTLPEANKDFLKTMAERVVMGEAEHMHCSHRFLMEEEKNSKKIQKQAKRT
jgi:hypothetical protein